MGELNCPSLGDVCQQLGLGVFFPSQCGYLDIIHLLLLSHGLYPARSTLAQRLLLSAAFFGG